MTRVLAIDPGSARSAWLILESERVVAHDIQPNEALLAALRGRVNADVVVIEWIESFGMAVGREIFETVHWSGRFTEAATPTPVVHLSRRKVKVHVCGTAKAKDANIRAALMDRFGGAGAKGTKAHPGPLYGVAADVFSALAIAVTYAEGGAA